MYDLIQGKYSIRDLVLMNPFRVLQLPVLAAGPAIRKHQQKLRFDLGQSDWKGPKPICLPLPVVPDGTQIQSAFSMLEDPVERLLAELFWFWPDANGDFTFGLNVWSKMDLEREGGAGQHNTALFHLYNAIQASEDIFSSSSSQAINQGVSWAAAFQWWKYLLERTEAPWLRLRARVLEIGDPRLDTNLIGELRFDLLKSIEGLAISYLGKAIEQRSDEAWSKTAALVLDDKAISELSFPKQLVNIANHELDRVEDVIASKSQKIRPITKASKNEIDQFFAETLLVNKLLLNAQNSSGISAEIRDEYAQVRLAVVRQYAMALRSHFVAYYNELDDLTAALNWTRGIDSLAIGGIDGSKIKEDLSRLEERKATDDRNQAIEKSVQEDKAVTVNLACRSDGYSYRKICVCCLQPTEKEGMWTATRKSGNTTYTRRISLPHCESCQKHKGSLSGSITKAVVFLLALVCGSTYFMGQMGLPESGGLIAGFLLGGGLFAIAHSSKWPRWAFSLTPLSHGHAHRGEPLEILGFDDLYTVIRFFNPVYGTIFAEINNSKLIGPYDYKKHASGDSLLNGRTGRVIAAWAMIGGALGGWATGEMGRDANRSSSRPAATYSRPSEAQSNPNAPATVTPAPATTPCYEAPPAPVYSYRDAERDRIKGMQAELKRLERSLNMQKSQLNNLQNEINSSSSNLDYYRNAGNTYAYNAGVDAHNSLIYQFRRLREDYNLEVSTYNQKLTEVNDAIDRYNANR